MGNDTAMAVAAWAMERAAAEDAAARASREAADAAMRPLLQLLKSEVRVWLSVRGRGHCVAALLIELAWQ